MGLKRKLCLAAELSILIVTMPLLLLGCGGGGTAGTASTTNAQLPVQTNSTNQVELAINDGLYHLWGFNYLVNGVAQLSISQIQNDWSMTSIYSVASGAITPPTPLEGIPTGSLTSAYQYVPGWPSARSWSYPANSSQAISTSPDWSVALNQQDVSGQTVLSHINSASFNVPLTNASAVFPAGSIAYTPTYVALTNRAIIFGTTSKSAASEAAMYGAGVCHRMAGNTHILGIRFDAANVVSLFNALTTCHIDALTTPSDIGSWAKTTVGGYTFYKITYPASITSSGEWAPAFINKADPRSMPPDLIIYGVQGSTTFFFGKDIPAGSSYTASQPFFNSAAIPALRSAAGL